MTRNLLILTIAAGLTFAMVFFAPTRPPIASASSFQPPEVSTGAPGEGQCLDCHTSVPDGNGSFQILGVPAIYQPGLTYTLTVQIQHTGQSRWGFEVTALRETTPGTFVAGGTIVRTSDLTLLSTPGNQYISHTSNHKLAGDPLDGTFREVVDGPVSWSFDWIAPDAGAGTVTFYGAGNAANNNNANGAGDFGYATSVSSLEGPPTPVSSTTWGFIKAMYR